MIDDTTARRIASDWHGGQGSALYAFASTGAIDTARDDHDLVREVNECYPWARDDADVADIESLEIYVTAYGPRGPQEGWSLLAWD